jgi:hypothetical protein
LSPIQSWNLILPSVVCASKSGAMSLIARAIISSAKSRQNLMGLAHCLELARRFKRACAQSFSTADGSSQKTLLGLTRNSNALRANKPRIFR